MVFNDYSILKGVGVGVIYIIYSNFLYLCEYLELQYNIYVRLVSGENVFDIGKHGDNLETDCEARGEEVMRREP